MKNLKSMSADELWNLRELVGGQLNHKLKAKHATLESRLRELAIGNGSLERARRPFPKVLPKFRNPKNRSELGQVEGSAHAGYRRSFGAEND